MKQIQFINYGKQKSLNQLYNTVKNDDHIEKNEALTLTVKKFFFRGVCDIFI